MTSTAAGLPPHVVRDELDSRILAAALAEFERNGIRRARVGRIADEARVGRATVYRRFADKDGLVEGVLTLKFETLLGDLAAVMLAQPDLDRRLLEGFVTVTRLVREDALLQQLLHLEPETVLPYLTVRGGPFLQLCVDYIAAQLREHQDRLPAGVDLEIVAEMAVRLVHSIIATPGGRLAADDESARAFAERYLVRQLLPARP